MSQLLDKPANLKIERTYYCRQLEVPTRLYFAESLYCLNVTKEIIVNL